MTILDSHIRPTYSLCRENQ